MDILQIIRKRRPNVRNIIIDYGHKKVQNIGNVPNKELVLNSWYNYYSGFLDNANNENDIRDVLAILLPLTPQEESDIFVMHHTDEEIYDFKRKAHELGIEISGTGVRNEFSYEDDATLNKEIDTVKRWIEVAAKMGAPVLRIFTAKAYSTGDTRKKVRDRIVKALNSCIPVAAAHGIVLGIQNHNDFLHTADECLELIKPFNSPWLGLVLDTGTFVAPDPYEEIRKATPLAVNWQLKEKLLIDGKQTLMDLPKLSKIIRECGYRGNVPIETLGLNDPLNEVPVFYEKVKMNLFHA